MSAILERRMTARCDGGVVVFLIGMRINRLWKVHRWLPVARAMGRMLRELDAKPELGLLHWRAYLGGVRSPLIVQYWRSFDALETYAKARDAEHLPAWRDFNRKVGSNGDVGIWHETYVIEPGMYETVYNNMPPHGLGAATELVPATGDFEEARQRIETA